MRAKDNVKIIVDKRERNIDILDGLAGSGIQLTFAQLPVGDYILSDRMGVERKTVSDLEGSVMNSRLFDQIERLNSTFKKPILLVEGDEADFTMKPNMVLGTIISVYADYNVQVIRSTDSFETVSILARLAEREQSTNKRAPKLVGSKRAFTNSEWQLLILGSIPGVGPTLARSMIRHFKTIKKIVSADTDDLMEVEKVGKKKAERIYEILNAEFSDI